MVVARQQYKTLKSTTMKTFFKVCPEQLIKTHDNLNGYTVLINGSFIYWMHLDDVDEQDIRGLEINSCLIDQAEEISENIYLVMDARIGRWDKAIVPIWLLRSQLIDKDIEQALKIEKDNPSQLDDFIRSNTKWPRHKKWGHFLVPNYMDVLCNPSDEDEFHWTYRRYNPASLERQPDHFYVHRQSDENLTDEKTYAQMLLRDPEWVEKYVKGKTGSPKRIIHNVHPLSIIQLDDYTEEQRLELLNAIKVKAAIFRILDHGETGVTCCLWAAILNNVHIFYREYYSHGNLISGNRQNIYDLSLQDFNSDNISYDCDYADPQIFKKTQQNVGKVKSGFWSVAEEYSDTEYTEAPAINWSPADNNELATRNRINELLLPHPKFFHPITKQTPAPGVYFIAKSLNYTYGIQQAIVQLRQQRRKFLGTDNGKNLYSEERDDKIPDHAYDCVRYHVAMHNTNKTTVKRKAPIRSFAYMNALLKRRPSFTPNSM